MTFCPNCGFNMAADEIIERSGFSIDPRGPVMFTGRRLRVQPQQAIILHSVATSGSRPVAKSVLAERIGYDGDYDVVRTQICKIRRLFRRWSVPDPILTDWGHGYTWGLQ